MANVADTLDELRRRAAAEGKIKELPNGRQIDPGLEVERGILVDWAAGKDLCLQADEWLNREHETHGEHHVFFDPDKQRYFKITHDSEKPDAAGFAIAIDTDERMSVQSQRWIGIPYIRDATPFEYLSRLVLFNRTFGDDIQLEGVICDPGQVAIVTSQPVIRGAAANEEQLTAAMQELGFVVADCRPLGKKNVISLSFYNLEEHVAVFDTHAENFLINDGLVAPIDALITTTDKGLEFYLSLSQQDRRKEIGLHTSAIHGL